FFSHLPLADMLVQVAMRAVYGFCIVRVYHIDPAKTDGLFYRVQRPVNFRGVGKGVPCSPGVGRVKTYPDAIGSRNLLEHSLQFRPVGPQAPPAAGHILEKY